MRVRRSASVSGGPTFCWAQRLQPFLRLRTDRRRHRNDTRDVRGAVGIERGRILRRGWSRLGRQGRSDRDRGDEVQHCDFHRDSCTRGRGRKNKTNHRGHGGHRGFAEFLCVPLCPLWFRSSWFYASVYFPRSITFCAICCRSSMVLNGSYFASRRRIASCVRSMSPSATAAITFCAADSTFSIACDR